MRFTVNVMDGPRGVVALQLEAAGAAQAAEAARAQGYAVLSVRARGLALPVPLARRAPFPVSLFSVELLALLEAGLNLVEALQALHEKETHAERRAVLETVLAAIRRGESFSHAAARLPQHFPPLYVATLRAAEQTGSIPEALGRYIAFQEELDRARKKVASALIYPAILGVVGSLVLAFLLFYVVPRFAQVYADMAGELPFFSRVLIGVADTVTRHGWALAAGALAAAAAAAWALSREGARAWLNDRLWRLPGLGGPMRVYQLARLYRTVGMLLRAGIPAVRALDMARDILAARLRPQLARAQRLIEEGQLMSAAFGAAGLATPIAARMMAVGERSGDMGEMMGKVARFHDEETARFIDWFTRVFEPLLMAVLGLAVGGVVVIMYMPVFELAGSIQ